MFGWSTHSGLAAHQENSVLPTHVDMTVMVITKITTNVSIANLEKTFMWTAITPNKFDDVLRDKDTEMKVTISTWTEENWLGKRQKQLEQMSGQILFKLNSALGAAYVTRLEFRANPKLLKEAQRGTGVVEFCNSSKYETEVAPAAARIKDDQLRNAFLRAAGKCLDRNSKSLRSENN